MKATERRHRGRDRRKARQQRFVDVAPQHAIGKHRRTTQSSAGPHQHERPRVLTRQLGFIRER